MTVAADIVNRLSQDARVENSVFKTVVFDYGLGVVELMNDGGYQGGDKVEIELETNVGWSNIQQYSEGQALPDPVESTYLKPAFSFYAFRGVIRESGEERRQRGTSDEGLLIKDPERKMNRCIAGIRNAVAKHFDDLATYGVAGIVSAGTYAFGSSSSTSRTTYTKLKSYELDNSSAAISTAIMNKVTYLAADDPYGAVADIVLVSATQARKIAELGSGKLAIPSAAEAGRLVVTELAWGTAPIAVVPNLTNSIALGLSGIRGRGDSWKLVWHEPNPGRYHVLDLGAANSDTPLNLQISTSLAAICDQPHQQWKALSLSTG